jgi:2-phospho-L-lactate guanylyltransferase
MIAGCYLVGPGDRPRRGCELVAIVAAMPTPLVPVKALGEAKRRLAPALAPVERRLLAIAMLEDVLAALAGTAGLDRPVVVSPDREVWHRAEALGCRVVEEHQPGPAGLNASLVRAAAAAGGDGLVVVAADLPLATPAGLAEVVAAARDAAVVVVPSHDGDGTNVLAWHERASFRPAFGPGSAARHLAEAGAVRVDDPGLALDVDTPEDLRAVAGLATAESVTGRRLRDLRLPARLGQAG